MRFLSAAVAIGSLLSAAAAQPQTPPPAGPEEPLRTVGRPATDPAALPAGAKLRLGSTLFRVDGTNRHSALSPDGKAIVQFVAPDRLAFLSVETGKETKSVKLKEQLQYGYGMSFSPTGERLVISSYNSASVVNPATGEVTAKLLPRPNNNGLVKRLESLSDGVVTLSGDGKRMAFGTRYPQQENQSHAYVYDADKGDVVAEFKVAQSNYITAVLSADGKTLASFGQYNVRNAEESTAPTVELWDVDAKKDLRKVRTSSQLVTAAKFSLDGKTLYTGGQGGPVEAWDVATGKKLRQYITRSNVGYRIFVSADGKRLAACSSDGAVQVWEADTGKRIGTGFAPTNAVESVALPADGPAVAFGLYSQTLQVWTVPGKVLTPQDGHFGPVSHIQYTADGKHVVTAGHDGRVVRWDAATGDELETYGYSLPAPSVSRSFIGRGRIAARGIRWSNSWSVYQGVFAPDTQTMYVQGGNGGVAAVDLATGQEQYTLFFPNARGGSGSGRPALSADGRKVGAAGQYYDRNKYNFIAAAWDTETGATLAEMKMDLDQNVRYINGMTTAISPDGGYFSVVCNIQEQQTGQANTEFTTFDLKTGAKIAASGQSGRAYSPFLQPSPDNRSVVSLDQQSRLIVWDMPTGKLVRTLTSVTNGQMMVFHPHGRTFAVPAILPSDQAAGIGRFTVRIVEWASGEVRAEIPTSSSGISALAYSPDGTTLAVGWQDSTVLLFDATGTDAKKPWEGKPTDPKELWDKLKGTSAKEAWAAVRELTDRPDVAMKLVRENVKPVPAPATPTADETAKLIGNLDAPAFAAREAAMKELKRLGKLVERELKSALETTPSPETKERIEKLLAIIIKPVLPNPTEARAVELLERIGTAEARAELQKLAAGDPASLQTQDAATSLKRLGAKK